MHEALYIISNSDYVKQLCYPQTKWPSYTDRELVLLESISLKTTLSSIISSRAPLSFFDVYSLGGLVKVAAFNSKMVFINVQLTADKKQAFLLWAENADQPLIDLLGDFGLNGYKLSASFDPERDCYIIAVIGTEKAVVNKSCCMTSRSSSLEEAMLMALYKHYVLAEQGDWSKIATANDDWG